jgi:hypothetical protein
MLSGGIHNAKPLRGMPKTAGELHLDRGHTLADDA